MCSVKVWTSHWVLNVTARSNYYCREAAGLLGALWILSWQQSTSVQHWVLLGFGRPIKCKFLAEWMQNCQIWRTIFSTLADPAVQVPTKYSMRDTNKNLSSLLSRRPVFNGFPQDHIILWMSSNFNVGRRPLYNHFISKRHSCVYQKYYILAWQWDNLWARLMRAAN